MKPTEEQLKDPKSWVRFNDVKPATDGFYAVKLNPKVWTSGEPFWLKYVGGRWSHGAHLRDNEAETRAENSVSLGIFIDTNEHEFLTWFWAEPALLDE